MSTGETVRMVKTVLTAAVSDQTNGYQLILKKEGFIRMNDLVNIISTIGFPIFSFLLCGYALKYVYDKERKSLDDAITKLGDLTLAVEHNSEAIRDLADKIGKGSKDV